MLKDKTFICTVNKSHGSIIVGRKIANVNYLDSLSSPRFSSSSSLPLYSYSVSSIKKYYKEGHTFNEKNVVAYKPRVGFSSLQSLIL